MGGKACLLLTSAMRMLLMTMMNIMMMMMTEAEDSGRVTGRGWKGLPDLSLTSNMMVMI